MGSKSYDHLKMLFSITEIGKNRKNRENFPEHYSPFQILSLVGLLIESFRAYNTARNLPRTLDAVQPMLIDGSIRDC